MRFSKLLAVFALFGGDAQAGYSVGQNPGIVIKINEKAIFPFQAFLQRYIPDVIAKAELPDHFSYTFLTWLPEFFQYKFEWTHIKYGKMDLRMQDVKFGITREYDTNLIAMDFPAIKEWVILAHEKTNSWFAPEESDIGIKLENFDIDFKASLRLNNKGYIDPVIYNCDIKFGNSMVKHSNWLKELVMHEVVLFSEVMIENSAYFFGEAMFTNLLGPVLDKFFNRY
jgi:hypothetical protein